MTCGGCAAKVESALRATAGVECARVNFATRRAQISFDPALTSLSALAAAVTAAGYTPSKDAPEPAKAAPPPLARQHERIALLRLLVAWLAMMQVMMFAYPAWVAEAGTLSPDAAQLMRLAGLILTTPVLAFCGAPFFRQAWKDLRRRHAGMDVPVALGLAAAWLASLIATWQARGEVYFDAITMFLAFLLSARWFEARGRARATARVEQLAALTPATATVLPRFPNREVTEEVALEQLRSGQHVLVAAGGYVPVDGMVVTGESCVDEAWLTGESRPVRRSVGGKLLAGSINLDNPLIARVSKVGAATELGLMLRLLEQAAGEKPGIVQLADRIAARFVWAILLLAALTYCAWRLVAPEQAFSAALAVLVVSCPCALSLATPVAVAAAQGTLARIGLLMARGHALETLARADHFVFDKTGTLTRGQPSVTGITLWQPAVDEAASLAIAAAMEQGVTHPTARALIAAARSARVGLPRASEVVVHPGLGVAAVIEGVAYRLGRQDFVGAEGHRVPDGGTPAASEVWLARGDQPLATFRLADELRPGAYELIRGLVAEGCAVSLLSGDRPEAVHPVAAELGIRDARAGCTPADKHAAIAALQARGAIVAMVGDGINDGPVLAQAHVSLVMGQGAPLAQRQGDLVLLTEQIAAVLPARVLARRTREVIRQNLTWAFGYNLLCIPLAMLGWMPPSLAALGMSVSSLMVVLNAIRLTRVPPLPQAHDASVAPAAA